MASNPCFLLTKQSMLRIWFKMLENSMPKEDVHHNIQDKLDSIPKLNVIVMEEECNKLIKGTRGYIEEVFSREYGTYVPL
ncbi:hypothetical protein MtrunA17_Chr4g0038801 [Medicago truncatula]|uniref:Uncharacterized protein n=1 Tax=Medicago truncatula TaxID=3880 RepID=G7JPM4_MEDTR|nr:hypothetical protein MTR_4g076060 [Medicago truncatula]RHN61637.1 hypothetical protein MtrunA17_Chr4g0038801 [Medicago truncatula]